MSNNISTLYLVKCTQGPVRQFVASARSRLKLQHLYIDIIRDNEMPCEIEDVPPFVIEIIGDPALHLKRCDTVVAVEYCK